MPSINELHGNLSRSSGLPVRLLLMGLLVCADGAPSSSLAGVAAQNGRAVAAASVPAPEFVGGAWLNTAKDAKLTLASRKGKVTVVHFWTFGCVNCKRNLRFYNEWQKRFARQGVEIIGVHTPETSEERDSENVARKVKEYGITYPVLVDGDSRNWKRWRQRYWPTVYLIDKRGQVRFAWEGELEYQGAGGNARMTAMIESLLRE